jgi:hypothetical protein
MDRTPRAVKRQMRAMGCRTFEFGPFKPNVPGNDPVMLPRIWEFEKAVGLDRVTTKAEPGRREYLQPLGGRTSSLTE